ncbi:MAG: cobyrinate a,c-diamide synthase, partial [Treponema sp.]|nr:cobyrinate a,c-diamide synthase [Treponema sp.]
MKSISFPRCMIASPASGSGKTVITCGIIKMLLDKGVPVQSFKCGPDYIDPMFHRTVLGVPSFNVDTYFTDDNLTKALFAEKREGQPEQSVAIVEGVMGFYDGLAGKKLEASSSDVARVLGLPVILVVDAKGMSRSVVALLKGFLACDEHHSIKAVILNRVSAMTFQILRELIETETGLCVLGYVPANSECEWKSRHLGLVLPHEVSDVHASIARFAHALSSTVDVQKLLEIAHSAELFEAPAVDFLVPCTPVSSKKIRISVARDEAFCFYYEDNLRLLQKLGANIQYFSPLHDAQLPACDGIILGGGYPELYGKELEGNTTMRTSIRHAVQDMRIPVLAECGGFMYLQESLKDKDGTVWKMTGVIPGQSFYADALVRFGYAAFSGNGMTIKGHEFHYFDSTNNGAAYTAQKPFSQRSWQCMVLT